MQDAVDRLAIRELVERYSDALNRSDFAALAAGFAPDAEWGVGEPFNLQLRGPEIGPAIAAMIERYRFFLQMIHGTVIDLGGDRASARTVVREIGEEGDGESGLDQIGIYHDELVRLDGGWRFARRRFEPKLLRSEALPGSVIG